MAETNGEIPSLHANIEIIKNLEEIDARAKIELIFILLGEKSATEVFVRTDDADSQKVQNLQSILIGIGLECSLLPREGIVKLKVAGNLDDLNRVSTSVDHRERGKLYGWPETAIDAYVRADQGESVHLLAIENLPEDVQNADYAPFCQFCFSEQWQQELEVPKRWSALAKQYAPELHAEFLREWQRIQERQQLQLEELSEPITGNLQQTTTPTPHTLVNVENRWGQALPDNKVRWLDTGDEEAVPWEHYQLIRKWKPEMFRGQMLAQKLHVFTHFELSHIESDEGDEMKIKTKLFGEYKKCKKVEKS